MTIELSEFPYKPKQMGCCQECKNISKKDCEPNPMNCIDFRIFNSEFIEQKAKEEVEE
jgi:hypothetical protein